MSTHNPNIPGDTPPGYDETWASDPSDYTTAATYAKDLNDGSGPEYYYRVVQEDYKLAVFTP